MFAWPVRTRHGTPRHYWGIKIESGGCRCTPPVGDVGFSSFTFTSHIVKRGERRAPDYLSEVYRVAHPSGPLCVQYTF